MPMPDHSKTLTNMSPETLRGWSYLHGRKNRTVLLTFRATPEEREAIRAAAVWERKSVAEFIRTAIGVRARDGYCKQHEEQSTRPNPCPGDEGPGR